MLFLPARSRTHWAVWLLMAVLTICLLLPVWLTVRTVWGTSTLHYELTQQELVIYFGPKTTRIDRQAITDVAVLDRLTQGRRIAGTALPNLKEGRFSYAETGRIMMYATSTQPLTVIETADGKWGISPADPAAFQQALAGGGTGRYEPVPGSSPWASVPLMLIPLLTLVLLLVLFPYLLRMPGRIRYELGPDALLIHGFLSPVKVAYDKIEAVETASPTGIPWKTFGASMPGLHWGDFSWKSAGGKLKLYATRLRPLVLIRAGRQTYGLTPEDEERFIEELSQRMGR